MEVLDAVAIISKFGKSGSGCVFGRFATRWSEEFFEAGRSLGENVLEIGSEIELVKFKT